MSRLMNLGVAAFDASSYSGVRRSTTLSTASSNAHIDSCETTLDTLMET